MQIKKFYANNVPAAIREVRRTLGPDAVILSTRQLQPGDSTVILNGGRVRFDALTGELGGGHFRRIYTETVGGL